jgi:hypothetical protein
MQLIANFSVICTRSAIWLTEGAIKASYESLNLLLQTGRAYRRSHQRSGMTEHLLQSSTTGSTNAPICTQLI